MVTNKITICNDMIAIIARFASGREIFYLLLLNKQAAADLHEHVCTAVFSRMYPLAAKWIKDLPDKNAQLAAASCANKIYSGGVRY